RVPRPAHRGQHAPEHRVGLGTVSVLMLGGLFGGVTMALGMLVHEASVLVVILNAMRLLRKRPRPASRDELQRDDEAHEGVDVAEDDPAGAVAADEAGVMKSA